VGLKRRCSTTEWSCIRSNVQQRAVLAGAAEKFWIVDLPVPGMKKVRKRKMCGN